MYGIVGKYKKVGISGARPFYFSIVKLSLSLSQPLLCLNNLGLSSHVVLRLISPGLIGGQNEKGKNFSSSTWKLWIKMDVGIEFRETAVYHIPDASCFFLRKKLNAVVTFKFLKLCLIKTWKLLQQGLGFYLD